MARKSRLPTLWDVSDALWARIHPLLDRAEPPSVRGRPREDPRRVLNGIIFQIRTNCPWNRIPKIYGDDSTLHRTYRRWARCGVFSHIWIVLLEACPRLEAAVVNRPRRLAPLPLRRRKHV